MFFINQSALTLSGIKASIKAVKEAIQITHSDPVLQFAAIHVQFNIDELESDWCRFSGEAFSGEHAAWLDTHCKKISSENGSIYYLNDSARGQILRTMSAEQMRTLGQKLKMWQDAHQKSQTLSSTNTNVQHRLRQGLFFDAIFGKLQPLSAYRLEELVSLHSIAEWLENSDIGAPDPDLVVRRIKQLELLRPFQTLTKNFSGRGRELKLLSDYVDWLPKEGMGANFRGFIRNVINWHEKPPMMINGVGGVGKSTLVARFILQHIEGESAGTKLPFVYFDFDKPGISIENPIVLLTEGLRQLAQQFPSQAEVFESIGQKIKEEYFGEGHNLWNVSRNSDREVFYQQYLDDYSAQLLELNVPILAVFDSFEEVQTRFGTSTLYNLFGFLKEIAARIPRLRTVFISRSDFMRIHDERFEKMTLEAFDPESALAYLTTFGLTDQTIAKEVVSKFGGHPLTLQLAADLIAKEGFGGREKLAAVNTTRLFSRINEHKIQVQLVLRNLDHIRDADVRKIAVPGLLVRKISPEVIQHVLAVPCGLGSISAARASAIYEELIKASFLLCDVPGGIAFRQDLRMALRDLILASPEYNSLAVHEAAEAWYAGKSDAESRAEFIYHHVQLRDDYSVIDELYDDEVGLYLNYSLPELPSNTFIRISTRTGVAVSDERLRDADIEVWEDCLEKDIVAAIRNGDVATLSLLKHRLSSRTGRSPSSTFCYFEAKLYERVGDFAGMAKSLRRAIELAYDANRKFNIKHGKSDREEIYKALLWRMIVAYLEYTPSALDERIEEYFMRSLTGIAVSLHRNSTRLSDRPKFIYASPPLGEGSEPHPLTSWIYYNLSFDLLRGLKRMPSYAPDRLYNAIDMISQSIRSYEEQLSLAERHEMEIAWEKFVRTGDLITERRGMSIARLVSLFNCTYRGFVHSLNSMESFSTKERGISVFYKTISSRAKFLEKVRKIGGSFFDHTELESYLFEEYGLHLKDVCEPGALHVNTVDVLILTEILNATSPGRG